MNQPSSKRSGPIDAVLGVLLISIGITGFIAAVMPANTKRPTVNPAVVWVEESSTDDEEEEIIVLRAMINGRPAGTMKVRRVEETRNPLDRNDRACGR